MTSNDSAGGTAQLPSISLPELSLSIYRLEFESADPWEPRGYPGSAWRGMFGRALKHLVCVTRETDCTKCMLYRSCVYPYVFETPPTMAGGLLGEYRTVPHPYTLYPVPCVGPSHRHGVELGLFGEANRFVAYLVQALRQAARQGLQLDGQPLELRSVHQEQQTGSGLWREIFTGEGALEAAAPCPPAIPPMPPRVKVRLETPLRLRHRSHYVTPESFEFRDLALSLVRRFSSLLRYHGGRELAADFPNLAESARHVSIEYRDLVWKDWTRYSSRQRTHMQLGGMQGQFELKTEGLGEIWPYLWKGQWTHAGKATSMGLGRYRIEAVRGSSTSLRIHGEEVRDS